MAASIAWRVVMPPWTYGPAGGTHRRQTSRDHGARGSTDLGACASRDHSAGRGKTDHSPGQHGSSADGHASVCQRRLWPGVDGPDCYRFPLGLGHV